MNIIHNKNKACFRAAVCFDSSSDSSSSCLSLWLREPACHSSWTGDARRSLRLVDLLVGSPGPNITLHNTLNTPQLSGELPLVLGAHTAPLYMCSSCSLSSDQCQRCETRIRVKSEYSHASDACASRFFLWQILCEARGSNFLPQCFSSDTSPSVAPASVSHKLPNFLLLLFYPFLSIKFSPPSPFYSIMSVHWPSGVLSVSRWSVLHSDLWIWIIDSTRGLPASSLPFSLVSMLSFLCHIYVFACLLPLQGCVACPASSSPWLSRDCGAFLALAEVAECPPGSIFLPYVMQPKCTV